MAKNNVGTISQVMGAVSGIQARLSAIARSGGKCRNRKPTARSSPTTTIVSARPTGAADGASGLWRRRIARSPEV